MEISVVVTALNHENTVIESTESILSQTRLPDQMGLALGPSRDETDGMAEFYEEEFDFLHRDRRLGVADCGLMHLRLGCLSSLTGDYVLFVRGDSYLRPGTLERIDAVGEDGEVLLSPAEFTGGINGGQRLDPPAQWTPQRLLESGPLPPGTVAWPRTVLEENFADLQGLKLGPFSTMGWLFFALRGGRDARILYEPAVEMWDDRDGASCWTGSVFETFSNLGSLIERWDGHGDLVNRIQNSIRSLPSDFRPPFGESPDDREMTETEPLEWVTSRVPLVE